MVLSMVSLAAWTFAASLFDWRPGDSGLMPLWPFLALLPGNGRELTDLPVVAWFSIELVVVLALPALVLRRIRKAAEGGREDWRAIELGSKATGSGAFELEEIQLFNSVGEMAIASGCQAPRSYVWEEEGVNSFIDAYMLVRPAIHVSRGALNALTREEIQALVAHQISRIASFDDGVMMRMALCNFFGYGSLRFARWKMRRPARIADAGFDLVNGARFALWLFYWPFAAVVWIGCSVQFLLGWLFASAVIRAQVRRADAFALQFTRNPGAIKSLLMKAAAHGGNVAGTPAARDTHACFASMAPASWFDTHPRIATRLRAVDPKFQRVELTDFLAAEAARKKILAVESPEAAARRHERAGRQEAAARARAAGRSASAKDGLRLVDDEPPTPPRANYR